MWRLLSLLVISSLLSFQAKAQTTEYDDLIRAASLLYLPWDPQWYRAQLVQESSLNPNAVSPVGAKGIAQFMPGTWADMQRELNFSEDPNDVYRSIRAGAFYNKKLRSAWKWKRPECDRRRLTFASYNAGLGNILKAQRYCSGATHWPEIKLCLHRVTGHHSNETLNYVNTIEIRYENATGKDSTCNHPGIDLDSYSGDVDVKEELRQIQVKENRNKTVPANQFHKRW